MTDLNACWQSIWDYFELQSPTPLSAVCDGAAMPNTRWFVGARVNYAQQVLRHVGAADAAGLPAILSHRENSLGSAPARQLSWPELRRQVASLALHLQAHGVLEGDRVAAYLPNSPQALVAFLATVSPGGVWSICAPDMGSHAVLVELCAALPTVGHLIVQSNRALATNTIKTLASQAYLTRDTGQNDA